MIAREPEQLIERHGRRIRRTAVGAPHLSANLRRQEQPFRGALSAHRIEGHRIGRVRVEVGDGLLQPGHDISNRRNRLLGQIAVQVVADPDVNSASQNQLSRTLISLS